MKQPSVIVALIIGVSLVQSSYLLASAIACYGESVRHAVVLDFPQAPRQPSKRRPAVVVIRAKLQCSRCHTICETCCEGGRG